jgi:hypothetical protein
MTIRDSEFQVQLRYAGIQLPIGEFAALVLAYPQQAQARAAFAILHDYITAPSGERGLRVSFWREDEARYTFELSAYSEQANLDIQISSVASQIVTALRSSLARYPYYAILAGHGAGEDFALLDPRAYHLMKRDIIIDGQLLLGTNGVNITLDEIFG